MSDILSDKTQSIIRKLHKVSVREIVDFVLRSGDITAVSLSDKRMVDGTKAHQKFQREQEETYEAEVSLNYMFDHEDISYMLTGRIDGVINSYEGSLIPLIDEIKSTSGNLEYINDQNEMHWAQVKIYAYMYLVREGLNQAVCRITYIELDSFTIKQFTQKFNLNELENYFDKIIDLYTRFAKMIDKFEGEMITGLKDMQFPFEKVRDGQSKLMKGVYKSIVNAETMFSRAPTGTGKTIATLFPGLKAIGEGVTEKLFYITPKTIGKEIAVKTLNILMDNKLPLKYVVITAKDKICIHTETNCNPDVCPYAKGHYDRINNAISEMYKEENNYTREMITKHAIIHRICPYELSLDLALFSQVIICDYNYVFDPRAKLRRFFVDGGGKYTLLVDEAHNLIDRGRKMFSAEIDKDSVLKLKKLVKKLDQRLYSYFDKLNKVFIDIRKEMKKIDGYEQKTKEAPLELETYIRGIVYRTEKIFKIHKNWEYMDVLLEFYFVAYDFIKKYEIYDDNYVTYYHLIANNLLIKLFCVDPRPNIREELVEKQGVVYFSATLLPMNYYKHLLGGNESSYGMNLSSPFEQKKLNLLIDSSISTKYVDREESISEIASRIQMFVTMKQGNYLVFFSSYKYMQMGIDAFHKLENNEDNGNFGKIEIMIQERNLSEEEREDFVKAFSHEDPNKSLVAFAVLGGMFSEGIDLVGEKLSGAVIVGVGLPLICFEQNIIKEFFQEQLGEGFDYAYTFPGMNKVIQAAGRVIRTSVDIGSVLLIDRRFATRRYRQIFPSEWFHSKLIRSNIELSNELEHFWENWNKY